MPSHSAAARPPSSSSPSSPSVLRLSSPADVLTAVPYLLGFHPARSLVVLGLAGPRGRLGLTLRVDLDGLSPGAMAERVVRALKQDHDTEAILLVYDPDEPAGKAGGLVPGEEVVATLRSGLRSARIRVRDALRVSQGRWWSYLCRDAHCCPPEGTPVTEASSPDGSVVAATAVHAGLTALPDRAALRASLEPPAPWIRTATDQALDRVGADLVRRRLDSMKPSSTVPNSTVPHSTGPHSTGPSSTGPSSTEPDLDEYLLDRIEALVDRFTGRLPTLDADEAALVGLGLHVLPVRDTVITWTLRQDADALERLLVEVVRRVAPPDHVPAATVLAWCAYLRGHGALASVALEIVDETDPDYSLAGLVGAMLDQGIHPDRLRETTEATAADLRQRRDRSPEDRAESDTAPPSSG